MAKRGVKPFYNTPAEMQKKIDEYFEMCKGEPMLNPSGEPFLNKQGEIIYKGVHPPTVTGLALALGFTSRQALINYQGKKDFVDTVTRAKMIIEQYCEERLFDKDGHKGAEFSLYHNFRWKNTAPAENENEGGGVIMMPSVKNE